MKKLILLLLIIPIYSLEAKEKKKEASILEQIIQPKITFQSDYLTDAKFENSQASVQTSKQKIQINNAIAGVSYSIWNFKWSSPEKLKFYQGKTPIESMKNFRLYANYPININKKWFMLNSVNINATYEKEYDGAFGGGIASFFSYKLDNEHSIQLGAFANYHSIKTLVLPVAGYSYRAREKDGLKVILGFPRAFIGYHVNPKLLLRTGFIYSQAVIRLADDSGIEPRGYIEAKDYQVNVGFSYDISSHFNLSGDILYTFVREFNLYNHNADKIDNYTIEPSIGATVRLKYLF